MYIQPQQYEKIKTITEKRAERFDEGVNNLLKKGWVIITLTTSELQASDFGSSREINLVATLGKPLKGNLGLKDG